MSSTPPPVNDVQHRRIRNFATNCTLVVRHTVRLAAVRLKPSVYCYCLLLGYVTPSDHQYFNHVETSFYTLSIRRNLFLCIYVCLVSSVLNCCYTSHSYCLIICTELNVFYISALGFLRTRSLTTLSAFQLHNEWSRLMKSSWCVEPYSNLPIYFTAKWNDVFTDQCTLQN